MGLWIGYERKGKDGLMNFSFPMCCFFEGFKQAMALVGMGYGSRNGMAWYDFGRY